MVRKPQLCPHGILGKTKCKRCSNETSLQWRRKHGIKPRPRIPCPHGISSKRKCQICRREYQRKYAEKKRRKLGIKPRQTIPCPHGIYPKMKCPKCKFRASQEAKIKMHSEWRKFQSAYNAGFKRGLENMRDKLEQEERILQVIIKNCLPTYHTKASIQRLKRQIRHGKFRFPKHRNPK